MDEKFETWLASQPLFEGSSPSVEYLYSRDGVPRYLLEWGSQKAVLKLYKDTGAQPSSAFERGAAGLARAEAAALREYAISNLAPELLLESDTPTGGSTGGSVVIYRWVEGKPADKTHFGAEDAERMSGALWGVHTCPAKPRIVSPHPPNLESWWLRAHEQYRNLSDSAFGSLPPELGEVFNKLTQSVAGDANAHKRFWQGAQLVPVHGSSALHNVILQGDHLTLVDWSRYGLGDPAFELASAVWDMALAGREEIVEELGGPYLARADDIMLARRLMIYRRLLPYSRLLDMLLRACGEGGLRPQDAEHGAYYLQSIMQVYGWNDAVVSQVVPQMEEWLHACKKGQEPLRGVTHE